MDPSSRATLLLQRMSAGDREAANALMDLVYDELVAVAERVATGGSSSTLQPTAMVHEAFLKLIDSNTEWESRVHFVSVACRAMRQVLADHARRRAALKRGGGQAGAVTLSGIALDDAPSLDLVALDQALDELQGLHERHARVVELRFLGGLSVEETARILGVTDRTVKSDWRAAKAWLRSRLHAGDEDDEGP